MQELPHCLGALTSLALGGLEPPGKAAGSLASLSSLREVELVSWPAARGLPEGIRALPHLTSLVLGLQVGGALSGGVPEDDSDWLEEVFGCRSPPTDCAPLYRIAG